MNILYVLYGDFTTNTSNPVVSFATELDLLGHDCVIAVTGNKETAALHPDGKFTAALYEEVLKEPTKYFKNGRPADVIHACTPRQIVCNFVAQYMQILPTPLCVYLEDNEKLISKQYMDLEDRELASLSSNEIRIKTHIALSHLNQYRSFIGLADLAILIQSKLSIDVPAWVPHITVMLGVDLNFFKSSCKDLDLLRLYQITENEKIIVYHGGLDPLKLKPIRSLCEAVLVLNEKGISTTLIRTGPNSLPFIDELGELANIKIRDIGIVDKKKLPSILSLADVYVQPGEVNDFEDLRLPGKIPEFFAMGKPVFIPNVNIAPLFVDQQDVIILQSADPNRMADQIAGVLNSRELMSYMGTRSRKIAEKYFDIKIQSRCLEKAYKQVIDNFDPMLTAEIWSIAVKEGVEMAAFQKAKSLFLQIKYSSDCSIKEPQKLWELIEEKLYRISNLESRVDDQILIATQEKNYLQGLLDASEISIKQLRIEIAALKKSHSWRVTLPLRNTSAKIKNFQDYIIKVAELIRFNGIFHGSIKLCEIILRKMRSKINGISFELDEKRISTEDYQRWIREVEKTDFVALREKANELPQKPLISIVIPTYNSNVIWLREVIESIRSQIYANWELCIADDASTNEDVKTLLREYQNLDQRVKVVFRSENGHISNASNSALQIAAGEFIGLVDHDDLLSPDALFWVADAINKDPAVGMIYSDEDKIDLKGVRQSPYFKSDWNLDLFYSHNMFSHFGVYKRSVLEKIGGFRVGYEGSQDYDLALRSYEIVGDAGVAHVPKVLYHWRIHNESTAGGAQAKPYAMIAGERAINDHFARTGVDAYVRFTGFGYRPYYSIPDLNPMVTVIIPTRNGFNLLKNCIDSILTKTIYKSYEIIVVDNNSEDKQTLEYLCKLADQEIIRVIRDPMEFNYSALNNLAVTQAKGSVIALLNNDVEVISSEWMGEMVSHALRAEVGAVGAKLLYPNNSIQHAGVVLGVGGIANHVHRNFPSNHPGYFSRASLVNCFSAVTAACLFIRKDLYLKVGGLDEKNLAVSFNDVDLCLRLKELGLRNIFTPYAILYHHESATRGYEDSPEKLKRFQSEIDYMQSRWGSLIKNDPMYNPNLSRVSEDFSLFWPDKSIK
jgi:GT2 family glycosyltransferase/glycosyltransferase involved in cell wall biosynthesis